MSQKFTLDQVLTAATGYALCEVDKIYEILNYLTQDDLYTHQLVRAFEVAAPQLIARYPELDVKIPEMTTMDEVKSYLDSLTKGGYKKEYLLDPIDNWEYKNPIVELAEMMNKN